MPLWTSWRFVVFGITTFSKAVKAPSQQLRCWPDDVMTSYHVSNVTFVWKISPLTWERKKRNIMALKKKLVWCYVCYSVVACAFCHLKCRPVVYITKTSSTPSWGNTSENAEPFWTSLFWPHFSRLRYCLFFGFYIAPS